MRLMTSSSSPLLSLVGRSFIGGPSTPFASTSRVQLRSLHSTPPSSLQDAEDRSEPSPAAAALSGLGNIVRNNSISGFFNLGGARAGEQSADVLTPGATPGEKPATGPERKSQKKPWAGQHLTPNSLSYKGFYAKQGPRKPPRLGPRRREAVKYDQLLRLGLNPGKPSVHDDSYKNPNLLSPYVTEMGKILPRSVTRLSWKSQRAVGKAIRRARSMGLIPVLGRTFSWPSDKTWHI